MKKKFLLILILLPLMVGLEVYGHDIEAINAEGQTLYYVWINNNTELALSFQGNNYYENKNEYSGDLIIPESVKYNDKLYQVTSIKEYTFTECDELISISIPKTINNIEKDAFHRCDGLSSIKVDVDNKTFDSRNNCNAIIETSTNTLIRGIKTTIIPNSVTSIGIAAFEWCKGLTSLNIPESVTSIGSSAFESCKNLKEIVIPNSVISIGNFAFESSGLTNITIPNSITSINQSTFSKCTDLSDVKLPSSICKIENSAFFYCSSLSDVIILAEKVPDTHVDAFKISNIDNATLHVPSSAFDSYKNTEPWNKFKYILKPEHIITYILDGEVYKEVKVEEDATIVPEQVPTKTGYTFSGWVGLPETMPDHDVTVTGSYIVNQYPITYMIDDEVYLVENLDYGAIINPPTPPSYDGFTFSWSDVPETMPAHDLTIYGSYSSSTKVILTLKNGNVITFYLYDKPEMTLSGDDIYISTATSAVNYLRADVVSFRFEGAVTNIEKIEYNGRDSFEIYDISGHLITSRASGGITSAKQNINTLKTGMYIIKIGNGQTIKYIKK